MGGGEVMGAYLEGEMTNIARVRLDDRAMLEGHGLWGGTTLFPTDPYLCPINHDRGSSSAKISEINQLSKGVRVMPP